MGSKQQLELIEKEKLLSFVHTSQNARSAIESVLGAYDVTSDGRAELESVIASETRRVFNDIRIAAADISSDYILGVIQSATEDLDAIIETHEVKSIIASATNPTKKTKAKSKKSSKVVGETEFLPDAPTPAVDDDAQEEPIAPEIVTSTTTTLNVSAVWNVWGKIGVIIDLSQAELSRLK